MAIAAIRRFWKIGSHERRRGEVSTRQEEARALVAARRLLGEIATGWSGDFPNYTKSKHKRVPKSLRVEAYRVLRHYPLAVGIRWEAK